MMRRRLAYILLHCVTEKEILTDTAILLYLVSSIWPDAWRFRFFQLQSKQTKATAGMQQERGAQTLDEWSRILSPVSSLVFGHW